VFPKAWSKKAGVPLYSRTRCAIKKRRYEGRIKHSGSFVENYVCGRYRSPKDYCELARAIKQRIFAYNLSIYLLDTYSHEETHNIFIRVNRPGFRLTQLKSSSLELRKDWPTAEQDMDDLYARAIS